MQVVTSVWPPAGFNRWALVVSPGMFFAIALLSAFKPCPQSNRVHGKNRIWKPSLRDIR
jgi:hypothetical protein